LPKTLLKAGEASGTPLQVSGMTASCDAWFYNNFLGIPALVYGPGSLKFAHSKDEQISMSDVAKGAGVLTRLVLDYCEAG
jgi:acetylornithine deacetylase/succinyl-diaminopimelate desuccinylase-like protein